MNRDKQVIRTRDNRKFMVEMQFGINVLSFLGKIVLVSDVFKVMGSSFQALCAATEKARLPKLMILAAWRYLNDAGDWPSRVVVV